MTIIWLQINTLCITVPNCRPWQLPCMMGQDWIVYSQIRVAKRGGVVEIWFGGSLRKNGKTVISIQVAEMEVFFSRFSTSDWLQNILRKMGRFPPQRRRQRRKQRSVCLFLHQKTTLDSFHSPGTLGSSSGCWLMLKRSAWGMSTLRVVRMVHHNAWTSAWPKILLQDSGWSLPFSGQTLGQPLPPTVATAPLLPTATHIVPILPPLPPPLPTNAFLKQISRSPIHRTPY